MATVDYDAVGAELVTRLVPQRPGNHPDAAAALVASTLKTELQARSST